MQMYKGDFGIDTDLQNLEIVEEQLRELEGKVKQLRHSNIEMTKFMAENGEDDEFIKAIKENESVITRYDAQVARLRDVFRELQSMQAIGSAGCAAEIPSGGALGSADGLLTPPNSRKGVRNLAASAQDQPDLAPSRADPEVSKSLSLSGEPQLVERASGEKSLEGRPTLIDPSKGISRHDLCEALAVSLPQDSKAHAPALAGDDDASTPSKEGETHDSSVRPA